MSYAAGICSSNTSIIKLSCFFERILINNQVKIAGNYEEKKIFYKEEDTSRALVKHLIENGLLPAYQDSFMNNLEQVLSGGLPTVRNKEAGHGQGDEIKTVDNK